MGPHVEVLEERFKSFLCQLQAECGILDKIIYKNKNQHRRCSYFQYLLKVRRDLKLLHSIRLEELLDSCFVVLTGRKAKQMAHLLESLKKSKCDTGKFNFMQRLLGAARLLSGMVEPVLKASVEISILLARSFFMGFSLMVLALLGRLRVLIQQMLLDVVSVFNEVSSIAQKKQSIKITQDGVEVFREYYPAMEEIVTLECAWKIDKFELVETHVRGENRHQDQCSDGQTPLGTSTQYRSVQAFLGEDVLHSNEVDADIDDDVSASGVKRKRLESSALCTETDPAEKVRISSEPGDVLDVVTQQSKHVAMGGSSVASSSISVTSSARKPNYESSKKVAFISVQKPTLSAPNAATFQVDGQLHVDKVNPLLTLFNGEDTKGSFL